MNFVSTELGFLPPYNFIRLLSKLSILLLGVSWVATGTPVCVVTNLMTYLLFGVVLVNPTFFLTPCLI